MQVEVIKNWSKVHDSYRKHNAIDCLKENQDITTGFLVAISKWVAPEEQIFIENNFKKLFFAKGCYYTYCEDELSLNLLQIVCKKRIGAIVKVKCNHD